MDNETWLLKGMVNHLADLLAGYRGTTVPTEIENARKHVEQSEEAESRRVADPSYTPTLSEACRHPQSFVDGMTEL